MLKKVCITMADFCRDLWEESKLLFFTELFGTVFSITGALLLSLGSPDPNLLLVFATYTVGSICIGIASYLRRSPWLLILMIFYTITNIIGIAKL